jgi:hypothetical protein
VIFDGPLEVDWNVGPLGLSRRVPAHTCSCSAVRMYRWRNRRFCRLRSCMCARKSD